LRRALDVKTDDVRGEAALRNDPRRVCAVRHTSCVPDLTDLVVESEAATADVEGFALDTETIRIKLEAERSRPEPRGIGRIILETAEAAEPPFLLEKVAFDRALGRFAVEHPERDGEQRKILALAEHLIQLTVADRRLAGDLRKR
jgi:hypothetical protein